VEPMRVRLSAVCSVWGHSHCIDFYIVFFMIRSIVRGSPRQRVALRVFFCKGYRQARMRRHRHSWRCQRRRRYCDAAAVPQKCGSEAVTPAQSDGDLTAAATCSWWDHTRGWRGFGVAYPRLRPCSSACRRHHHRRCRCSVSEPPRVTGAASISRNDS